MVPATVEVSTVPACPGCGAAASLLHAGRPGADFAAPQETYRIARMSYSTPLPVYRCADCGAEFPKWQGRC